jgi:hypothetical protein
MTSTSTSLFLHLMLNQLMCFSKAQAKARDHDEEAIQQAEMENGSHAAFATVRNTSVLFALNATPALHQAHSIHLSLFVLMLLLKTHISHRQSLAQFPATALFRHGLPSSLNQQFRNLQSQQSVFGTCLSQLTPMCQFMK